ncbi:MAG: archease [Gaiella sp.]|nr:archease [Gaiella sp.]
MAYRFVDHTAELQLELEAPTREGVLGEAVLALGELLGGDEATGGGELVRRRLAVAAADDAALLAAWIDEVVFVAESEALVPRRAEAVEVDEGKARGTVTFAPGAPPHLVKGVTYHDLLLAPGETGWRGRAVLDV